MLPRVTDEGETLFVTERSDCDEGQVRVTVAVAELLAVFESWTLPETVAVSVMEADCEQVDWFTVENVMVTDADSAEASVPMVHCTFELVLVQTAPVLFAVAETKV